MYRKIEAQLKEWKETIDKKPLLIKGARQIGKTYSVQKFIKNNYKRSVSINFEENLEARRFFCGTSLPSDIVSYLNLRYPELQNDQDERGILFLDEIQACPQALTSLKFMQEPSFPFDVIASGSLLGVAIQRTSSFPVGYVTQIEMFPMDFEEFLLAAEPAGRTVQALKELAAHPHRINEEMHQIYLSLFDAFVVCGGLPESVKAYAETREYSKSRKVLHQLNMAYKDDIAKYADAGTKIRARECFESIPLQLAKDNRKFQYKLVHEGYSARHFEASLQWLRDSGLIYPCFRLSRIEKPLEAFRDLSAFKIYEFDTGILLSQMSEEDQVDILLGDMGLYKGFLYENVCAQILACTKRKLYYAQPGNSSKIDFVINLNSKIVPIEVKAGKHTKSRSLNDFVSKYSSESAYRFSRKNMPEIENQGPVQYLPYYLMPFIL